MRFSSARNSQPGHPWRTRAPVSPISSQLAARSRSAAFLASVTWDSSLAIWWVISPSLMAAQPCSLGSRSTLPLTNMAHRQLSRPASRNTNITTPATGLSRMVIALGGTGAREASFFDMRTSP